MSRTRVRWDRVLVLAAVLAGSSVVAVRAAGGSTGGPVPIVDRYVVRSGDTLWELARRSVGREGDPRPLVDGIREINGMETSQLLAGEELILPAP
jgi:LysM domain-containing protein